VNSQNFLFFLGYTQSLQLRAGRVEINHYSVNTDPFVLVKLGSVDKVMVGRIHCSAQAAQEHQKMPRRTR
jgi:hypothetical protein